MNRKITLTDGFIWITVESVVLDVVTVFCHPRDCHRLPQVLPEFGNNITNKVIMAYPVLSVGQAKKNHISAKPVKWKFDDALKCHKMNYLAVYPNGDVYPCCSQMGCNGLLKIGNMNMDSMDRIKKNYNANMIIRILTKHSFRWFVDKMP